VSDSAAADIQDRPGETATPPVPPYEPVRIVPTRPDGWPDWLGRRPVSSADRGKILKDLQAGQDEMNTAERRDSLQLAPLFSCLTIEGLGGQDDPARSPGCGPASTWPAGSPPVIAGPATTPLTSASRSGSPDPTPVSASPACAGN